MKNDPIEAVVEGPVQLITNIIADYDNSTDKIIGKKQVRDQVSAMGA